MTVSLIARAEWHARPPSGSYSGLSSTRGVKVHYTGGRIDPRMVDDHGRCVAAVQEIQGYHMDGNGWLDIGYSAVACWHRRVFIGRGLHHLPAANGPGLNSGHYAVLGLVGNAGLTVPNDELLLGILDAIDWLRREGGAGREIKGHQDGYSTDCPGEPLYAWVKAGAPRPGGDTSTGGPSSGPAFPGRLLRYPPVTRGADVRRWQERARELEYGLAVDGVYGPASRAVCREIQHAAGLDDDGVVGPDTWGETFRAR